MAGYNLMVQNKETGAIFTHTAELAALPFMVSYVLGGPGDPNLPPPDPPPEGEAGTEAAPDTQDWRKITRKSDLAEFANLTYGIDLDQYGKLSDMRAELVRKLQKKHPGMSIADCSEE